MIWLDVEQHYYYQPDVDYLPITACIEVLPLTPQLFVSFNLLKNDTIETIIDYRTTIIEICHIKKLQIP